MCSTVRLAAESQAQQDQQCTFAPAINRRSAALAAARLQRTHGAELTAAQRLTSAPPARPLAGALGCHECVCLCVRVGVRVRPRMPVPVCA